MYSPKNITYFFIFLYSLIGTSFICAQNQVDFKGQFSALGSYAPDHGAVGYLGARYLPELSYTITLDSSQAKIIDFEASANVSTNALITFFNYYSADADIAPYRIWARYNTRQFELRLGLQKIDFGSASLIRPIQWFNQIDPRDPLQLTNGVYGLLGRYYFLNNANIWMWALLGNDRTRGFDLIKTNKHMPEFGGRYQHPTQKGELAFSYHFRHANATLLGMIPDFEKIPEHRIGIDGKWDLTVGVWFEAAAIHKRQNIGSLTNQTHFNFGMDYTFGIGNGLHVSVEHLLSATDESFLGFEESFHLTGTSISYPLGFYDNFSAVALYNWKAKNMIFNAIYNHDYGEISAYFVAFYSPANAVGFQQNDLINQLTGPGFRVMLVYHH